MALSEEVITMQIYDTNKFVDIKIVKLNKTTFMNKKCLDDPSCKNLKVRTNSKKDKLVGQPASKACAQVKNSQYKILNTADGDQIAFCVFKNGAMKSAWSLIND